MILITKNYVKSGRQKIRKKTAGILALTQYFAALTIQKLQHLVGEQ